MGFASWKSRLGLARDGLGWTGVLGSRNGPIGIGKQGQENMGEKNRIGETSHEFQKEEGVKEFGSFHRLVFGIWHLLLKCHFGRRRSCMKKFVNNNYYIVPLTRMYLFPYVSSFFC